MFQARENAKERIKGILGTLKKSGIKNCVRTFAIARLMREFGISDRELILLNNEVEYDNQII